MPLLIDCIFDPEFGPGGMDPLGKLVISNGASQIAIEPTYFDSWLGALIDSLPRLHPRNHVSVQIQEEPIAIEIDVAADGTLAVSYRDHKVTANGKQEFESALRAAVNSFLDVIRDCPDSWQNRNIDPIRRFWATTHN